MSRYDDPDEKTVFKLRLRREHRELWALLKILAILASVLASIGGAQYYLCNLDHPKWSMRKCLANGVE